MSVLLLSCGLIGFKWFHRMGLGAEQQPRKTVQLLPRRRRDRHLLLRRCLCELRK